MSFFDFLDSFWNNYIDRQTTEIVWEGYSQTVEFLYTHLYEVNLGKSINDVPIEFTDMFVQMILDQRVTSPDAAYPYAYSISENIIDIPVITDNFDDPSIIMFTGEDYIVYPNSGIIAFKNNPINTIPNVLSIENTPPVSPTIGDRYIVGQTPVSDWVGYVDNIMEWDGVAWSPYSPNVGDNTYVSSEGKVYGYNGSEWVGNIVSYELWAAELTVDLQAVRDNFGELLDFTQDNTSFEYLRKVQGLWLALWAGPTIANEEMGMHILLGAPFAFADGTITEIIDNPDGSHTIRDSNDFIYYATAGLNLTVSVGDIISKFDTMTDAAEIMDYLVSPDWYHYNMGFPVPAGYTPEYWELKKYHHFTVWVRMEQLWEISDGSLVDAVNFLNKIKPSHTDFTLEVFLQTTDNLSNIQDDYRIETSIRQDDYMLDMCLVYNDPRGVVYGEEVIANLPNYDGAHDYNEANLEYYEASMVGAVVGYRYPGDAVIRADLGYEADTGLHADSSPIYSIITYPWKYECKFETIRRETTMRTLDPIGMTETALLEVHQEHDFVYNDPDFDMYYDGLYNYELTSEVLIRSEVVSP